MYHLHRHHRLLRRACPLCGAVFVYLSWSDVAFPRILRRGRSHTPCTRAASIPPRRPGNNRRSPSPSSSSPVPTRGPSRSEASAARQASPSSYPPPPGPRCRRPRRTEHRETWTVRGVRKVWKARGSRMTQQWRGGDRRRPTPCTASGEAGRGPGIRLAPCH